MSVTISSNSNSPPARAKHRVGKKAITGFFDPAVSKQLKRLAVDKESSIQELMRDALNSLFEKHGQSKIA